MRLKLRVTLFAASTIEETRRDAKCRQVNR
jgi:hypothetical protein